MFSRIYIDNVRSFVNFEWAPDRLALLLGPNGAGKTALFETLFALRGFITGERSAGEAFPESSRTRWETRAEQTLELEARTPYGTYAYRLVLNRAPGEPGGVAITEERLRLEGDMVIEFAGGLNLRVDIGGQIVEVPGARPYRSGISAVQTQGLRSFQELMSNLCLLRPDPRAMTARIERRRTNGGIPVLDSNLSNFASWYLAILAAKPGTTFKAIGALGDALPGFTELYDNQGTLEARFERQGMTTSYSFDELSDGERALIALYILLHVLDAPGRILLLDEPDNYLGLREIQPWLAELSDRALRSDGPQAFIVSHNPEALNFLAPERGIRLFRDGNGPTRIERFHAAEGLAPDETIARGLDDQR